MAVFAGSATAILSLLWHAPVQVACLHGGVAWLGVVLVGKSVGWFLERADALDRRQSHQRAVAEARRGEL